MIEKLKKAGLGYNVEDTYTKDKLGKMFILYILHVFCITTPQTDRNSVL